MEDGFLFFMAFIVDAWLEKSRGIGYPVATWVANRPEGVANGGGAFFTCFPEQLARTRLWERML